ncbi:hypothetical protein SLEP1_g22234 [Rubroshorea leprosula]|uniref:TF-B3 domain-containing protein n=1 Tax=Rubroshorea leprosula TaxID=152421 RepID=A0AAV5JKJ5_9ROSI|nr:hypothetical protein SLEP1_g22234 [Rubroshorea leprosula]
MNDHLKTATFKPKVVPTLSRAISVVGWVSQNLLSPVTCQRLYLIGILSSLQSLYALSLHNFMAFSLSPPTPLHHLTRFSCFFNTWIHPTGSIFHPTTFLNHTLFCTHFKHTTKYIPNSVNSQLKHHRKNPETHHHILSLSMENSSLPFSTITSTSTRNSDFSVHEPLRLNNFPSTIPTASQFCHPSHYVSPSQSLQLPHAYSVELQAGQPFGYPAHPFLMGQNVNEFGGLPTPINGGDGVQGTFFLQTDWLNNEQERKTILDPYITKVARIKRRLARQRSLSLHRNSSTGASSGLRSSTQVDAKVNSNNNIRRDLYKFCTPDNKRLRVLLKKDLKNSDVASLGRIVLPKREAEENLPKLSDKEGIPVVMRDIYSKQAWTLKYKFWINNKSRMYVLENTGDFVKHNGLEIGDSLTLYEDESKNLYFSITKAWRIDTEPSNSNHNNNSNNNDDYNNQLDMSDITYQPRDEEEASLALLIEQLEHTEQQEYYDLTTLSMNSNTCYSYRPLDQEVENDLLPNVTNPAETYDQTAASGATIIPSSPLMTAGDNDNQFINFDDCYGSLGMLPDVDRYNFSL